jgi:hypothetical protein
MCMLCVVPPNVLPSRDKLTYSAINNPDGFGFAIVISSEKRILVEHTMDADEAVNRFLELRAKYPDDYALWHARYATHGTVNLPNCHPFYVVDDKTVLAHNGVLPIDIPAGDKRSDTRIFTEDILAQMGGVKALDNPHMYNMIEEYTSGSKLCVLTVDPRADYQMYLIHSDKGSEDESKVWWSNDSCNADYGYARWTASKSYGSFFPYAYDLSADTEGVFPCVACNSYLDEDRLNQDAICPMCHVCQWCDMTADGCLCYKKSSKVLEDNAYQTAWEF